MRKMFLLSFGLLMCFLVMGCGVKNQKEEITSGYIFGKAYGEVKNFEEAKSVAGFSMKAPESIFENDTKHFVAVKGKAIQIRYIGMERVAFINKSLDEGEDNNVGDYNDYPELSKEIHNNLQVEFHGNYEKINILAWKSGGYNYSINVNPGGVGMDKEEILNIMNQVN